MPSLVGSEMCIRDRTGTHRGSGLLLYARFDRPRSNFKPVVAPNRLVPRRSSPWKGRVRWVGPGLDLALKYCSVIHQVRIARACRTTGRARRHAALLFGVRTVSCCLGWVQASGQSVLSVFLLEPRWSWHDDMNGMPRHVGLPPFFARLTELRSPARAAL